MGLHRAGRRRSVAIQLAGSQAGANPVGSAIAATDVGIARAGSDLVLAAGR